MNLEYIASAKGVNHSLLLTTQGRVVGWGKNNAGQLGDGTTIDRERPQAVIGIDENVVGIGAGRDYSLALSEKGEVYSWGEIANSNIAKDGKPTYRPKLIEGLHDFITAIAGSSEIALALAADGQIWAWTVNPGGLGGKKRGLLTDVPMALGGFTERIIKITAGGDHFLALSLEGNVWSFGDNETGQLGENEGHFREFPRKVKDIGDKVSDIAAGKLSSFVLTQEGEVMGFGDNPIGQIGELRNTNSFRPQIIKGLNYKTVRIACGDFYTLILNEKGQVLGWGNNTSGELGISSSDYIRIPTLVTLIDPKILLIPFGTGGRTEGYSNLEKAIYGKVSRSIVF